VYYNIDADVVTCKLLLINFVAYSADLPRRYMLKLLAVDITYEVAEKPLAYDEDLLNTLSADDVKQLKSAHATFRYSDHLWSLMLRYLLAFRNAFAFVVWVLMCVCQANGCLHFVFTSCMICGSFVWFQDLQIHYLVNFCSFTYALWKLFFAHMVYNVAFVWWRFAKPVDVQVHHETDELQAARKQREEV